MYNIISNSRYGTEIVDTADDLKTAIFLQHEYAMAFGLEFTITISKA